MATLHFDGDKRRVYEVPVASSFITDGNGFRIYTPDDIPSASTDVRISLFELWSRGVDYHNENKWTTLIFNIAGGLFRTQDADGNDVFALPDLRWINDWAFVPANYPHKITLVGNIYPNLLTGVDFDVDRLTVQGVSPRIEFADRGERTLINTGGTALSAQETRDAFALPLSNGTTVQAGSLDAIILNLEKYEKNRWKIQNNQLVIYDDDGVTPLTTFNLFDPNGNPTEVNPTERVPV